MGLAFRGSRYFAERVIRLPGDRIDGSMVCAGVLIRDIGGVLIPRHLVERSTGAEAGFSHLTAACKPVEAGQLPQPDGLIEAGGGQVRRSAADDAVP